jgi:MoxR-like ATPase
MSQPEDLSREIEAKGAMITRLRDEIGKVMVGQRYLIDRLILALIGDGHVLVEGLPGLAKTTAIKALADAISSDFSRVQFTPDLLPADLIGTQIYRPHTGEFETKQGPIFTNLLLADEINRAPAKVQSALLESMAERQVTLGEKTQALHELFMVLATQNPIEQEGTYPLPEAQVDRFMLKLDVGYPTKEEEKEIMRRMSRRERPTVDQVMSIDDVLALRRLADEIYLDDKVSDYIVEIVYATREPGLYNLDHLDKLIEYGASPRATIYLAKAARVHALMAGRGYVTPQDIKTVGPDVLRHRVHVTYEAEARDLSSADLLAEIFSTVDVP